MEQRDESAVSYIVRELMERHKINKDHLILPEYHNHPPTDHQNKILTFMDHSIKILGRKWIPGVPFTKPRQNQLIAAVAYFFNYKLQQVATGEGKSLIVALIVCTCVQFDECLHIVTSNETLRERDQCKLEPILTENFNAIVYCAKNVQNDGEKSESLRELLLKPEKRTVIFGTMEEFCSLALTSHKDVIAHMHRVAEEAVHYKTNPNTKNNKTNKTNSVANLNEKKRWHMIIDEIDTELIDHIGHTTLLNECTYGTEEQFGLLAILTYMVVNFKSNLQSRGIGSSLLSNIKWRRTLLHNAQLFLNSTSCHMSPRQKKIMEYLLVKYLEKVNEVCDKMRLNENFVLTERSGVESLSEETGITQENVVFSHGTQQMLSILHSHFTYGENVVSRRLSTILLLRSFYKSIGGMSGSLGTEANQLHMRAIINSSCNYCNNTNETNKEEIEILHVSSHQPSKLITMDPYLAKGNTDFLQKLKEVIMSEVFGINNNNSKSDNKVKEGRVAIIITESVAKAMQCKKFLEPFITACGGKLISFTRSDLERIPNEPLTPGTIFLSTMLCHRGEDILLSESVLKSDGALLIDTFIAPSERLDIQKAGRVARKGQRGSLFRLINLHECPYFNVHCTECTTLENLERQRDATESIYLSRTRATVLPQHFALDEQCLRVQINIMEHITCTLHQQELYDLWGFQLAMMNAYALRSFYFPQMTNDALNAFCEGHFLEININANLPSDALQVSCLFDVLRHVPKFTVYKKLIERYNHIYKNDNANVKEISQPDLTSLLIRVGKSFWLNLSCLLCKPIVVCTWERDCELSMRIYMCVCVQTKMTSLAETIEQKNKGKEENNDKDLDKEKEKLQIIRKISPIFVFQLKGSHEYTRAHNLLGYGDSPNYDFTVDEYIYHKNQINNKENTINGMGKPASCEALPCVFSLLYGEDNKTCKSHYNGETCTSYERSEKSFTCELYNNIPPNEQIPNVYGLITPITETGYTYLFTEFMRAMAKPENRDNVIESSSPLANSEELMWSCPRELEREVMRRNESAKSTNYNSNTSENNNNKSSFTLPEEFTHWLEVYSVEHALTNFFNPTVSHFVEVIACEPSWIVASPYKLQFYNEAKMKEIDYKQEIIKCEHMFPCQQATLYSECAYHYVRESKTAENMKLAEEYMNKFIAHLSLQFEPWSTLSLVTRLKDAMEQRTRTDCSYEHIIANFANKLEQCKCPTSETPLESQVRFSHEIIGQLYENANLTLQNYKKEKENKNKNPDKVMLYIESYREIINEVVNGKYQHVRTEFTFRIFEKAAYYKNVRNFDWTSSALFFLTSAVRVGVAGVLLFKGQLALPAAWTLLASSYFDFKKSIDGDQFVFRKELLETGVEVLSMALNTTIDKVLEKVISMTSVELTGENLSPVQQISELLLKAANFKFRKIKLEKDENIQYKLSSSLCYYQHELENKQRFLHLLEKNKLLAESFAKAQAFNIKLMQQVIKENNNGKSQVTITPLLELKREKLQKQIKEYKETGPSLLSSKYSPVGAIWRKLIDYFSSDDVHFSRRDREELIIKTDWFTSRANTDFSRLCTFQYNAFVEALEEYYEQLAKYNFIYTTQKNNYKQVECNIRAYMMKELGNSTMTWWIQGEKMDNYPFTLEKICDIVLEKFFVHDKAPTYHPSFTERAKWESREIRELVEHYINYVEYENQYNELYSPINSSVNSSLGNQESSKLSESDFAVMITGITKFLCKWYDQYNEKIREEVYWRETEKWNRKADYLLDQNNWQEICNNTHELLKEFKDVFKRMGNDINNKIRTENKNLEEMRQSEAEQQHQQQEEEETNMNGVISTNDDFNDYDSEWIEEKKENITPVYSLLEDESEKKKMAKFDIIVEPTIVAKEEEKEYANINLCTEKDVKEEEDEDNANKVFNITEKDVKEEEEEELEDIKFKGRQKHTSLDKNSPCTEKEVKEEDDNDDDDKVIKAGVNGKNGNDTLQGTAEEANVKVNEAEMSEITIREDDSILPKFDPQVQIEKQKYESLISESKNRNYELKHELNNFNELAALYVPSITTLSINNKLITSRKEGNFMLNVRNNNNQITQESNSRYPNAQGNNWKGELLGDHLVRECAKIYMIRYKKILTVDKIKELTSYLIRCVRMTESELRTQKEWKEWNSEIIAFRNICEFAEIILDMCYAIKQEIQRMERKQKEKMQQHRNQEMQPNDVYSENELQDINIMNDVLQDTQQSTESNESYKDYGCECYAMTGSEKVMMSIRMIWKRNNAEYKVEITRELDNKDYNKDLLSDINKVILGATQLPVNHTDEIMEEFMNFTTLYGLVHKYYSNKV